MVILGPNERLFLVVGHTHYQAEPRQTETRKNRFWCRLIGTTGPRCKGIK